MARLASQWDECERLARDSEAVDSAMANVIDGVVRGLGDPYSDDTPRLEIHVPIERSAGLPFRTGERVPVRLRVAEVEYSA